MLRLIVTSATYRQSSRVTPRGARARSREPAAGARPAAPAPGRDDPRPGAGARRAAGRADRRAVGEALSAGRALERAGRRRLRPGPRARASTAAACTRSGSGRSRRRRWSRSTPPAARPASSARSRTEHAAPGPQRAERRHLRRGRPGLRRADACTRPGRRPRRGSPRRSGPRPAAGRGPRSWPSCSTGFDDQLARFRRDPEAAAALIAPGESAPDPRLDPGELAAYTAIAQLILNLDETITKE